MARTAEPLQRYRARRDFRITTEPGVEPGALPGADGDTLRFVVQKHDATRLHYDFRLELDGVLLSWAVPKGPSLDPADKRMAVRTEDHPLAYAGFEGRIPAGQYGAGDVIVWDRGSWLPLGDARAGLEQGKLGFELQGHKLAGRWELVRLRGRAGAPAPKQETWLLLKKRDAQARPQAEHDVVQALTDSVLVLPPPAALVAPAAAGGAPPGAVPAPLPATLSPQLALLATAVPAQGRWVFETKFDGYRLMACIEAGVPRLITRGGHDWTARLPGLAQALAALHLDSAWLDGEIVMPGAAGAADPAGGNDFNALQNAFDRGRTQDIRYVLFDLPYFEGHDLRDAPLAARRELLRQLLLQRPQHALSFSEALGEGSAPAAARVLQAACAARLEGIVAKRLDAPYRSSREGSWLKLKCQARQEFVVGGYTVRSDDGQAVGSLILGVHDEAGRLVHAGSVGTGWSREAARALRRRLQRLGSDSVPFADGARGAGRWSRRGSAREQWLKPQAVVEVAFAGWTPAGHIRHASFVAERSDKPAREIRRETAREPEPARARGAAGAPKKAAGAPKATAVVSKQTAGVAKKAAGASKTAAGAPEKAAGAPKQTAGSSATTALARRSAGKAAAGSGGTPGGVRVTHPERVIDAASGARKLDLVRYYDSVADFMLPHLQGRPAALLRAPGGVGASSFFQKHDGKSALPGVRELDAEPGQAALLEVATREALLGAAQMNVFEFHTGNARTRNPAKPDRMVFDLDPGEGVAWPAIREGAALVRALLQELGLQSWLKTSGGKGLHLVVPLASRWRFETVKAFSRAVVQHLAQTIPARFVVKSGPANRVGRIFVDYLRNGEGATTVAAFSVRARPGLGVSMPLHWDELATLKGAAQWTLFNARDRLSLQRADPWADMATARQSLTGPMKRLGFKPAAAD